MIGTGDDESPEVKMQRSMKYGSSGREGRITDLSCSVLGTIATLGSAINENKLQRYI